MRVGLRVSILRSPLRDVFRTLDWKEIKKEVEKLRLVLSVSLTPLTESC